MRKVFAPFFVFIVSCSFFFVCCKPNKAERQNDFINKCAQTFADSFFNLRYRAALTYCTPESHKYMKFIASNITQSELDLVRNSKNGASVELSEYKLYKGGKYASVDCKVHNYLKLDTIGGKGYLASKGNFTLFLVKQSDGTWKVDLNRLKLSK